MAHPGDEFYFFGDFSQLLPVGTDPEDEGRDCSFYVQETAWYSHECEQAWKSWNELFTGVSHELRGRHKRCVSDFLSALAPAPSTGSHRGEGL